MNRIRIGHAAISSLLLSGPLFGESGDVSSQTYERCEVNALMVDDVKKSAALTCFSGKSIATWVDESSDYDMVQPESGHYSGNVIQKHLPWGIDFKSETANALGHEACNGLDDLIKSQLEKSQQVNKNQGYCRYMPEKDDITVNEIQDDMSFYYMALKNDLVLTKVSIAGGKLTQANLKRGGRYLVGKGLKRPFRKVGFSEEIIGHSSEDFFRDSGGLVQYAKGSSIPLPEEKPSRPEVDYDQICQLAKGSIEKMILYYDREIARYEEKKQACNDGIAIDDSSDMVIEGYGLR